MYDRQSDAFIQAADAGSFSRTAEALLISSTAVVKQIDLLEGSLGVQLFGRTPRGQSSYTGVPEMLKEHAGNTPIFPEALDME